MMNKKGITGTTFVLIISVIGVALLFTGVFGSYVGLAGALGVDFDWDVLSRERGVMGVENDMIIKNVECWVIELHDDCNYRILDEMIDCNPPISEPIIENISCTDFKFEDHIDEFDEEKTLIFLDVNYWYRGTISSQLEIYATAIDDLELEGEFGGERTVGFSRIPRVPFNFEGQRDFILTYSRCEEEQFTNISVSMYAGRNPTARTYYMEGDERKLGPYNLTDLELCILPPVRDVDVYVDSFTFEETDEGFDFSTIAGITGGDIPYLCPEAMVGIRAPDCEGGDVIIFLGNLYSDRRKIDGEWIGEDYGSEYRIEFTVENELDEDLTWDETARVELDFDKGWIPAIPSNCNEIIITNEFHNPRDFNIVETETDDTGRCLSATVEFVISAGSDNYPLGVGEERLFYAYYGGQRMTVYPDVSGSYPRYTICENGCDTSFNAGNLINLTTSRFPNNLTLKETWCVTD